MNREHKRKQYETGYYKTHPCREGFTCKAVSYTHLTLPTTSRV